MKILCGLMVVSFIVCSADAREAPLSYNGEIKIDGQGIRVIKNKYGGADFEVDFILNKNNSSPILPGYTPKYNDSPPKSLECGMAGASFYIRHDALPFATPPNLGRYYIVRTRQLALASSQCKRLKEVWVRGRSLKIPLLFLGDHWKYDGPSSRLLSWGGSNNIYFDMENVLQKDKGY